MVLPMVTSPRTVSRLTRTPRTERSAAVGMPRQAVVELPDGTTSWAGCTGGPSGLGALVARPGWVHWWPVRAGCTGGPSGPVSYTHLRAHETRHDLVCRLLLEKK